MKSRLNIGLVGCGHWGKNILRDLKTLNCKVWVVVTSEQSLTNAKQFEADHLVAHVNDLPSFLDGYIVATPDSTHTEVIKSLLSRQQPIFVEKPLTIDADEARLLASIGSELIFVMDKWRYHAGIEALADIASTQKFGKPLSLRSVRRQWQHRSLDADEVWHLGTHDLSITKHILGTYGFPIAAIPEWLDNRLVGLCGFLDVNGIPSSITVSCRSIEFTRRVELLCETGVAVMHDPYADHILISQDAFDKQPQKYPINNIFPLLKELTAFIEYLSGGPAPLSSVQDAAGAVEKLAELRELAITKFPCYSSTMN